MARRERSHPNGRPLLLLTGIIVGVAVIGVLYWAQSVLIPVALAIFFTFLLNPVVTQFQRWHLPRIPAVLTVTLIAAVVVFAMGWLVISQFYSLVNELPNYSSTIKKKIEAVQEFGEALGLRRFEALAHDLGIDISPQPQNPPTNGRRTPVPPNVVAPPQTALPWLHWLPGYALGLAELLAQTALVIVLTIFMLLGREDLRNRFIRLVGYGHMTVTTKAVDDATQRLSRFLLMQLVINTLFGLSVAAGLTLLGVEYALLWGFLGAMLRYLPYIGSPLAALFPLALTLIQFETWLVPLLVVVLVLGLEAVAANVLEPLLYGQSIGVSPVALLIAAAFWAFLWGPIGLVLSCPLTVCLVVLGKYVPYMRFLNVLLGDEPALDEDSTYYQRLSAHDEDEALRIARAYAKANPPEKIYDDLLVPALMYATRDRQRGGLDAEDIQFIHNGTHAVLTEVNAARMARDEGKDTPTSLADPRPQPRSQVRILGVAARDENDELALQMLQQLLADEECELEIAGPDTLSGELLQMVQDEQPTAVCIAALPPGGQRRVRLLCKRLRKRFGLLRIIVGRWGAADSATAYPKTFQKAGASQVQSTLLETCKDIKAWLPALTKQAKDTDSAKKNGQDQNESSQWHGACDSQQPAKQI